jgi:hypothetical protein
MLCRNWAHDIMLQFFFSQASFKDNGEERRSFSYEVQWFEKNCIPQVVNNLMEYGEIEDQMRREIEHRRKMDKKTRKR